MVLVIDTRGRPRRAPNPPTNQITGRASTAIYIVSLASRLASKEGLDGPNLSMPADVTQSPLYFSICIHPRPSHPLEYQVKRKKLGEFIRYRTRHGSDGSGSYYTSSNTYKRPTLGTWQIGVVLGQFPIVSLRQDSQRNDTVTYYVTHTDTNKRIWGV